MFVFAELKNEVLTVTNNAQKSLREPLEFLHSRKIPLQNSVVVKLPDLSFEPAEVARITDAFSSHNL